MHMTEMNLVYRVENMYTQQGPFQSFEPFNIELAALATRKFKHLAPSKDGLIMSKLPYFYVFGCLSLESLANWIFLSELSDLNEKIAQKLHALDFRVNTYIVPLSNCAVGSSGLQVLFDPDDNLAETSTLDTLLKLKTY